MWTPHNPFPSLVLFPLYLRKLCFFFPLLSQLCSHPFWVTQSDFLPVSSSQPLHSSPPVRLLCSPPLAVLHGLTFSRRMRQNCVRMRVGVNAKFRLGRFASSRHGRGEKRPDPGWHKQTESCQTHTLPPLHSPFCLNLRHSLALIVIHFTLS